MVLNQDKAIRIRRVRQFPHSNSCAPSVSGELFAISGDPFGPKGLNVHGEAIGPRHPNAKSSSLREEFAVLSQGFFSLQASLLGPAGPPRPPGPRHAGGNSRDSQHTLHRTKPRHNYNSDDKSLY